MDQVQKKPDFPKSEEGIKNFVDNAVTSISDSIKLSSLHSWELPPSGLIAAMVYEYLEKLGYSESGRNSQVFWDINDRITEELEDIVDLMAARGISEMRLRKVIREQVLREFVSIETHHGLLDVIGQSVKLSDGMIYHLSTMTPIDDNVYRPGTQEFFALFREARNLQRAGFYDASDSEMIWLDSDIGEWGIYENYRVPLDFPMWDEESQVSEAKYKGREVTLGLKGAKRSGGRAYVYVKDPKTGKIKKIFFGSSMPDAMGDSEAHRKRRKSFGDRHGCAKKKDKTKPGYWACRATKMFGRNIPGWW